MDDKVLKVVSALYRSTNANSCFATHLCPACTLYRGRQTVLATAQDSPIEEVVRSGVSEGTTVVVTRWNPFGVYILEAVGAKDMGTVVSNAEITGSSCYCALYTASGACTSTVTAKHRIPSSAEHDCGGRHG